MRTSLWNHANEEARAWYLEQEKDIPKYLSKDASLKTQAKQAFGIRNEIRTTARNLMSDREAAASLEKTDPNFTWKQVVSKYSNQGYKGDQLWNKIIESSQKSRQSVNKMLGVK